jgi:hypothetical protein
MITVVFIALVGAAVRGLFVAALSWRDVPRSNEDMVFF